MTWPPWRNYPLCLPFFKQTQRPPAESDETKSIAIPQPCRDNLKLMMLFIEKAFTGVDMNLTSFMRPTHIYRSDSCPFGLGCYLHKGFAWRLELQEQYCFRASINLLEIIALIITPWMDMMAKRIQSGGCVLSMMDSTTSAGWLKRTNFSEEAIDPIEATICLKIARKHASLFIHHNTKEYLQWFLGKKNNVADNLSRDFDLSNSELTKALRLHCPSQLPPHFQDVPLPSKIES
jgi:hypothetical protein